MTIDYLAYVETFNVGDDDELVEQWFTEDFVYVSPNRIIEGRPAWREFFRFVHNGVREVFRAECIIVNDTSCFAEIDTDFHGLDYRPDFPLGALSPGQMFTVKFFANYKIRDGRFCHLRTASWPPNKGVTIRPRLGGEPTQVAAMESFLAAVEHGELEFAEAFCLHNVVLVDKYRGVFAGGPGDVISNLRGVDGGNRTGRHKNVIFATHQEVAVRLIRDGVAKFQLEGGLIRRVSIEAPQPRSP